MIIGLLLLSLFTAGFTTVLGLSMGMPFWIGFLSFPAVGALSLLVFALLVYARHSPAPDASSPDHQHDEPALA